MQQLWKLKLVLRWTELVSIGPIVLLSHYFTGWHKIQEWKKEIRFVPLHVLIIWISDRRTESFVCKKHGQPIACWEVKNQYHSSSWEIPVQLISTPSGIDRFRLLRLFSYIFDRVSFRLPLFVACGSPTIIPQTTLFSPPQSLLTTSQLSSRLNHGLLGKSCALIFSLAISGCSDWISNVTVIFHILLSLL